MDRLHWRLLSGPVLIHLGLRLHFLLFVERERKMMSLFVCSSSLFVCCVCLWMCPSSTAGASVN